MRGTRLVIADRHPIVLQGLMSVFAAQRDFEIVAWCSNGTSCLEAIRNLAPDIALLGDSFSDVTASEILAIADDENVPIRLVFFTAAVENSDLAAAIAAGACSVISKYENAETLLRSLRLVAEGVSLLPEPSPELAPTELAPTGKEVNVANIENVLAVLTNREREIMRLVAEGLSNKAIARRLNISDGTIKVHLHHIYQKLEIRNRTVLAALAISQRYGGFGALLLAVLTAAAPDDVQAADPDATFLDDDSIAYEDLEHGVFELRTKEAIPRHVIVDDPGRTVELTRVGSSISVSQVTNSVARMEELQAAQKAVFANLAKGYGPNGSSTPYYYFNPQLLQPINYVPPGSPTTQASLPPLESASNPVREITIVRPLPLPSAPPTLNTATGPILVDTAVFDTFTASNGIFVGGSPRGAATLAYGISGGTAGQIAWDGITYDVWRTGLYGTLYLNSATGAYAYIPDNDAVNALTERTAESFTITVSDGTLSANQTYTVAINGINDAAVISGATSGSVAEAGSIAKGALGASTATGMLTDTDVDNAANTFTAVTSPRPSMGGYGTFTMTAAGAWLYTLDNANSAVQALNAGDTLTDSFTVTTVDGTAQVVTVTITGSNDAAVISGTASGSVIEAGGTGVGTPVATGTLTNIDVDNAANTFTAVNSATQSDEGYGTFTMTAAGVWTYTLDHANSEVQALNVGGTLTDSFTVTTVDGTAQAVTVTITGTNDAAVVSGTTSGSVAEAGGTGAGTSVATGTLTDIDVDNTANTFSAVSSPTESDEGYGAYTMTAAGVWTYTLDNTDSAVQALNAGDTLTDSFTVTTVDGTAQVVTITITGSNDAAVISGTASGSVIEADGMGAGIPVATGTLTDIDVDNTANTFTAVNSATQSDEGYGTFTMTASGVWTYTLDNADSAVQALDVGDTLTDTFTVATADGTTQVVTVTIHGSSDADPNDFDNLAPGPEEVSDPPFVYGTPQGENIAGGGDKFQIVYAGAGEDTVNGTGRDDTLYAGSGNDTIKGNDGCDTIYGGSGIDTVNGNNGDDSIIGGFGGDRLTGSNGNDTFVYLAVADSNSARFDVITDFASGSDRINLAAFGALAFMALSPTATSVPPHTVAWIYDSTNNQVIVYVNRTDQTLDIGDPALLEIHLQGVASVQESDFVYEPVTATVAVAGEGIDPALAAMAALDVLTESSAGANASESASVAGSVWTIADESFSFRFARERVDPTSSVRSASLGKAPEHATEDGGDDAVTLASAPSIELPRDQGTSLVEDHFTFDQGAIPASTLATTASDAAATLSGSTIDPDEIAVATATPQHAEEGATPSAADQSQSQPDLLAASEGGSAAIEQHAEYGTTPASAADHGESQRDLHAASEGESAATEQHAAHDATPGGGAEHGKSQRDLHTASEGGPAAEQHAAHDATPGNSAEHGHSQRELHAASESDPAVAEQHAAHDAGPGNSAEHGKSHRDLHMASEGAPAEQHAAHDAAPKSGAEHGKSQRDLHAASESDPAVAEQHAAHDAGPGSGAGHGHSQRELYAASESGPAAAEQHAAHDEAAGSGPGHGRSQRELHAASESDPAAAEQHAGHDAAARSSAGHGQSQRELHTASESGPAAAEHGAPGGGANRGQLQRELHAASESGSAAAEQHAEHRATPARDTDHGQSQRDLHAASDRGLAAAEQHAGHDAAPGSGASHGQSQRDLHAVSEGGSAAEHGAPGGDANRGQSQRESRTASEGGPVAAEQHAAHDAAPESGAGHGQSQRELHAASEIGPAAAEQHAGHDAAPGSGAGHGQSQRDLHTASESGPAAAEQQHAAHEATPGSGTGHGQSQRELHAASESGPAATEQHAGHDAASGSGPDHGRSQRELQTASEGGPAAAEQQHAAHGATPGSGAGHGQSQRDLHTVSADLSNSSDSESNLSAAGEDQPALADAGHAEMAAAPEFEDSFQFKDKIAASKHSDTADLAEVGHGPARGRHAAKQDGLASIQDAEPTWLSLAEQTAADHAKGGHHHVTHDLIV